VVSVDHAGSCCCWVLNERSPSDWSESEILRRVRSRKDSRGEYLKFMFFICSYGHHSIRPLHSNKNPTQTYQPTPSHGCYYYEDNLKREFSSSNARSNLLRHNLKISRAAW
jgi:hypothetical protein